MTVANAGITVNAPARDPPIWLLTTKNSDRSVKLYDYRKLTDELPETDSVSITNRNSEVPLTSERIRVRKDGK